MIKKKFLLIASIHLFYTTSVLPDTIIQFEQTAKEFIVHGNESEWVLNLMDPNILRVEFVQGNRLRPWTLITDPESAMDFNLTFMETDSSLRFSNENWLLECMKATMQFKWMDENGRLLQTQEVNPRRIEFKQDVQDHFYGFGSKSLPLDRKGAAFRMWNQAIYGYKGVEPTLNINIPFFVNPKGYGLYFDNPWPVQFDLGETDSTHFSYQVEGGSLVMYLIYGPGPAQVLKNYTWLTGRQPMPPQWALGYLQSKYGYQNQEEVLGLADTLGEKDIPCSAIVLDLYWFGSKEKMGNLTWGKQWPDPPGMIQSLKKSGKEIVLIEEPYITQFSHNYAEGDSLHVFCTDSTGETAVIDMWASPAGLLDVTNDTALRWWWKKHRPLVDMGVGGFWTDLGEPETHPTNLFHQGGPPEKVHNIFSLLWNRGIFLGYQQDYPRKRVFQLSRAGFAGMQRYGVFPWSGDVDRSWAGLQAQLPIMLNMGMSGVGYMHSDLGGFIGTPDPELYLRWLQFGTFCPIMRPHGMDWGTHPWDFDVDIEKPAIETIRLRRRLLPYLYQTAYENHRKGMPLARPLILAYPDDPEVSNLDAQYMLGSDLMICPVVEPDQRTKSIYLPEGQWIDFYTHKTYSGGQWMNLALTLDHIPVFVKAGAIIPMLSPFNADADTLYLLVYLGHNRVVTLYEDDGQTCSYLNGGYCLTPIVLTESEKNVTLEINPVLGDKNQTRSNKIYQIHLIGLKNQVPVIVLKGEPLNRQDITENKGRDDVCFSVNHAIGEKTTIQIKK